ncbi:hypothetical protein EDB19DRAFT_1921111 [Suillus lakei]|nr:hypothetical protein EDB19DRAFT_1921111 [Suillus lakei]
MRAAAQSNPTRFAQFFRHQRDCAQQTELGHQREISAPNADTFDLEAQRRIEEAIRQLAVMEYMEHTLEYSMEAFGQVTMLYMPVEVNPHPKPKSLRYRPLTLESGAGKELEQRLQLNGQLDI